MQQQTLEDEPTTKVCGSRCRSTQWPKRSSAGTGARRNARPPGRCVPANARARAHREGVWQHTPESADTEMEQWRCGYVPECETTRNVCGSKRQSVSLPRRYMAADAGARASHEGVWQQMLEREPALKVCGSRRWSARWPRRRSRGAGANQSTRPPRMCVAANAGVRARQGGVWQQMLECEPAAKVCGS